MLHANTVLFGLVLAGGCGLAPRPGPDADAGPRPAAPVSIPAPGANAHAEPRPREIRFAWKPSRATDESYAMDAPEDQHRIVLLPGVGPRAAVVVALHGQPKRGASPRAYAFGKTVEQLARQMVGAGEIQPFVLALPVFRYLGTNWPEFDLGELRQQIDALLAREGILPGAYYVFGHSGAAGCGGDGLNHPLGLSPAGAGFIDTCVGPGFARAVGALETRRIPTLVVHSVETAGFSPKQPTEYMAAFDFGRVYRPLGLSPVDCPADVPEGKLRDQPFRCAVSADGVVRAFVVDTGQGEAAHERALGVGARFFLRRMLGPG